VKRYIVAALMLWACGDSQQRVQGDWDDSVDIPHFDAPAVCPAPNTPQAASYVDHGGSSNALEWLLLLNALTPAPSYHVVHHYDDPPPLRYRTRPTVMPASRSTTLLTPAPTVTRAYRASPSGSAPASAKPVAKMISVKTTSPALSAPKSASYGFRTTSSPRPSSMRVSSPSRSR
jgi:hypothetical protein